MPVISMFYGIIIRMYHFDDEQHHRPHIHVEYAEASCVIDIETGNVLKGKIQKRHLRLVEAWIEIHRDELIADWTLAVSGEEVFKIKPLD